MQRAIINADDCGRTLEVDKAIVESMDKGEISSTTIMANGNDFESVKSIFDSHPDISFGAHLVLDELGSLTRSPIFEKVGITDTNGVFIKGGFMNVKYTKDVIDAIYIEWCAQIEKILKSGIRISHIDSHHHVHVYNKALLKIIRKLSKKYGIKKIRGNSWLPLLVKRKIKIPSNTLRGRDSNKISSPVKAPSIFTRCRNIFNLFRLHNCVKRNFISTDYFMSAMTYYVNRDLVDAKLGHEVLELMCHPGHQSYQEETKILSSIKNEISLMNYNEL